MEGETDERREREMKDGRLRCRERQADGDNERKR